MENMRRVTFKKLIPAEWEPNNGGRTLKPGTGCWTEFVYYGFFHEWGCTCEEGENFGNYTVGLVETNEGTIEEVLPSNLKFINT